MSDKRSYPEFVVRLKQAMIEAGYGTTRSPSGVAVEKLCEITQSTRQNCRRFLRGEALPDHEKILNIAQALDVDPGWLLFGERGSRMRNEGDLIHVQKEILFKVFEQAAALLRECDNREEVAKFLVDLVQEVASIQASEGAYERIIRLAITSYLSANRQG